MLPGDVRFLYQRCSTYAEKGSALILFRFQGYISLSRETYPLHLTFNSASYLQQLAKNKNCSEPLCIGKMKVDSIGIFTIPTHATIFSKM